MKGFRAETLVFKANIGGAKGHKINALACKPTPKPESNNLSATHITDSIFRVELYSAELIWKHR